MPRCTNVEQNWNRMLTELVQCGESSHASSYQLVRNDSNNEVSQIEN